MAIKTSPLAIPALLPGPSVSTSTASTEPGRLSIQETPSSGATQLRFCCTLSPPRMISPKLTITVAISRNDRIRVISVERRYVSLH